MGNLLKGKPAMNIGAVVNPGASDLGAEIENLHRKKSSRAGFFQSQAIYDVDALATFLEEQIQMHLYWPELFQSSPFEWPFYE
ncbi:MAG: hypothetical protein Ct9H300mP13_6280 [Gammaproteobacteria bacterium]|nr:MAG: hypothetical protein Ct9H300mP13_6280 [Gammaproteobacteria bacterium]